MSCSKPPDGRARWTLRLLADKAVELAIVDAVSHETVRSVLKKRIKALPKGNVGDTARKECGIRGLSGGCFRPVPTTI
jgi:hypothetical protein